MHFGDKCRHTLHNTTRVKALGPFWLQHFGLHTKLKRLTVCSSGSGDTGPDDNTDGLFSEGGGGGEMVTQYKSGANTFPLDVLREACLGSRGLPPSLPPAPGCPNIGDADAEGTAAGGGRLPVQPEGPRRVQGQRPGRLVPSVLLRDVVQLLLVDVNVVFGGDRLSAQAASVVHLDVCVTGRDRHRRGMKANLCLMSAPFSSSFSCCCSVIKTPGLSLSALTETHCRFSACRLVTSARRQAETSRLVRRKEWGNTAKMAHSDGFSGDPETGAMDSSGGANRLQVD